MKKIIFLLPILFLFCQQKIDGNSLDVSEVLRRANKNLKEFYEFNDSLTLITADSLFYQVYKLNETNKSALRGLTGTRPYFSDFIFLRDSILPKFYDNPKNAQYFFELAKIEAILGNSSGFNGNLDSALKVFENTNLNKLSTGDLTMYFININLRFGLDSLKIYAKKCTMEQDDLLKSIIKKIEEEHKYTLEYFLKIPYGTQYKDRLKKR